MGATAHPASWMHIPVVLQGVPRKAPERVHGALAGGGSQIDS